MGDHRRTPVRRIQHFGPRDAQRLQAVECRLSHAALSLPGDADLLGALAGAVAGHGVRSAVCTLRGGTFSRLGFVMPALSRDAEHAVYYSERHLPAVPVALESATVTVGLREGRPWFHCHGVWRDAGGRRLAGHVLPDQARIAEPIAASLWLVHGADYVVGRDAETRFDLFQPVAHGAATGHGGAAFALQVRPNEDICQALEAQCAARGIAHARVRGGVGSLVGAVFDDGRTVEPFVTEVLVHDGRLAPGDDGAPRAALDASVVDHTGGLAHGRLARGCNPVLVTFELVVEPVAADA